MVTAIKILIMLGVLLVLAYPFIPLPEGIRKLSPASALKYRAPHNRKNIFFVVLIILEFVLVAILFRFFDTLAATVSGILPRPAARCPT